MGPTFNESRKIVAYLLSFVLVAATIPGESALSQAQEPQGAPGGPSPSYQGQGVPASPQELQNLVAPIALYPDALVAQVLSGATFPDQVATADDWMQQNKNLSGSALMTAVDQQPWDPSVKALTQFPSVLDNMAKNLAWTSQLGEAYHNQQADVMAAIQTMRAKAQAAGNLNSGSQITVTQPSPQTIVIEPANPQVIYVPTYNPTVIYGTPYYPPGYSTAGLVATSMLTFGAGIAVGAMMSGGCCGWGYSSWNVNWHGGGPVYHGAVYYGNTAWHGGYYGTSRSAYGPYGSAHYGAGYNPSTGTYARGASTSTPYGTQRAGQAYNPNTGAYGATHQASNAYGNYGSSVVSKNGQTAYTQHQTTAQGSVGTVQTSEGGRGVAGTNANGNFAAGQAANGNKYATANGTNYRNTGSGLQKETDGSWNNVQKPASSSDAARGWGSSSGSVDRSTGSSAFSGWGNRAGGQSAGGWDQRVSSSRGWASRGGGGGWGGGGFRR